MTIIASDGILSSSESIFNFTVNNVNDAPVLATVSDVAFDEDASTSISISASDVDGDDLTFSITGGSEITATLDGSDIVFTASENFNGSETFTVTAADSQLTDSQDITVTVNAINDPPVATTG